MNRIQRFCADKYQRLRIMQYRFLSDCARVTGKPVIRQPVQFVGEGSIKFNGKVNLGYYPSPFFFNGYIYLEARSPEAVIEFGDGVYINNNCFLISDGPGISVGEKTMLGTNCEIIDSNFHDLHGGMEGVPVGGKVVIGNHVLIGSNVKILKGVKIGNNTVIANGSVVTRSVPENSVVFGNPAKAGIGLATVT
jgi:acetyltransferase-like isoleucine patch superfamily enzyme